MNAKFVSCVVALGFAISGNSAFGVPRYDLDRERVAAVAKLSLNPSCKELMDELIRQEQVLAAYEDGEQYELKANSSFGNLEKIREILTSNRKVISSQKIREVLALNLSITALVLFEYTHGAELSLYNLDRLQSSYIKRSC
jgi:hypothetical protein